MILALFNFYESCFLRFLLFNLISKLMPIVVFYLLVFYRSGSSNSGIGFPYFTANWRLILICCRRCRCLFSACLGGSWIRVLGSSIIHFSLNFLYISYVLCSWISVLSLKISLNLKWARISRTEGGSFCFSAKNFFEEFANCLVVALLCPGRF